MVFVYKEVNLSFGCHLRKVGNANDLVIFSNFLHHSYHLQGHLTRNTGINLIENKGRQSHFIGHQVFNRKKQTGKLTS